MSPGRTTDHLLGQTLTPRESQVLNLVAAGKDTSQIAGELYLTDETVKTHRRRVLGKLGANNMQHAVAIGFRKGLLA